MLYLGDAPEHALGSRSSASFVLVIIQEICIMTTSDAQTIVLLVLILIALILGIGAALIERKRHPRLTSDPRVSAVSKQAKTSVKIG